MPELDIRRVRVKIEQLFRDKIDMSDYEDQPDDKTEKAFLSRALAAYSLHVLASIDVETAAQAIVDGFDDNGIDAILFERNQKRFWVVQSKWIDKGNGEPVNGDVRKYTGGVRDLLESKFERFDKKVRAKETDIIDALNDSSVQIELVIAYTGHNFSTHNDRIINDLLGELNETSELASFQTFNINKIYQSLLAETGGNPIKIDLVLSNWGYIEEPYKAYYGQIYASDIAQWWFDHRRVLFADNVRNFLGTTDVNKEIIDTLRQQPQHFLYFNNGVTVLCKRIVKKPLGGGDKAIGLFTCEGISIVNGAQTVACIGQAFEKPSEDMNSKAKVFARFISLENCPEDFDTRITIATNTQNRIEKRDFVSLDPRQEALKIDLAMDGKIYHYRRTDEKPPIDDKNCDFEEAAIALACGEQYRFCEM